MLHKQLTLIEEALVSLKSEVAALEEQGGEDGDEEAEAPQHSLLASDASYHLTRFGPRDMVQSSLVSRQPAPGIGNI